MINISNMEMTSAQFNFNGEKINNSLKKKFPSEDEEGLKVRKLEDNSGFCVSPTRYNDCNDAGTISFNHFEVNNSNNNNNNDASISDVGIIGFYGSNNKISYKEKQNNCPIKKSIIKVAIYVRRCLVPELKNKTIVTWNTPEICEKYQNMASEGCYKQRRAFDEVRNKIFTWERSTIIETLNTIENRKSKITVKNFKASLLQTFIGAINKEANLSILKIKILTNGQTFSRYLWALSGHVNKSSEKLLKHFELYYAKHSPDYKGAAIIYAHKFRHQTTIPAIQGHACSSAQWNKMNDKQRSFVIKPCSEMDLAALIADVCNGKNSHLLKLGNTIEKIEKIDVKYNINYLIKPAKLEFYKSLNLEDSFSLIDLNILKVENETRGPCDSCLQKMGSYRNLSIISQVIKTDVSFTKTDLDVDKKNSSMDQKKLLDEYAVEDFQALSPAPFNEQLINNLQEAQVGSTDFLNGLHDPMALSDSQEQLPALFSLTDIG